MSGAGKAGASRPRPPNPAEAKQTEFQLKARVKELEQEIAEMKRKQEELRRAKNTTKIKREREVLQVGEPFGKRDLEAEKRKAELEKLLAEQEAKHRQEVLELHEKHREQLLKAQKQAIPEPLPCGHEPIIESLRAAKAALEADVAAIMIDREDLANQVDNLFLDLSIKEAQWLENENELKDKLRRQYGDKYAEWMQETEQKIEELQKANTLLRKIVQEGKGTRRQTGAAAGSDHEDS